MKDSFFFRELHYERLKIFAVTHISMWFLCKHKTFRGRKYSKDVMSGLLTSCCLVNVKRVPLRISCRICTVYVWMIKWERSFCLDFSLHHLSLVHNYEDTMSSTQIYEVYCILGSICFVDLSTAIECEGDHCISISN
jgi:hypothetical protein